MAIGLDRAMIRPLIPLSDLSAVILSGGQSRRLQGEDKGLIKIAGKPMIEYVIESISPQVKHVFLSANRHLDVYRRWGFQVFSDAEPEKFQGPLAGLLMALTKSPTDWLLSVPCDVPCLPDTLALQLLTAVQTGEYDCAVVSVNGAMQPVCTLCHRRLSTPLQQFLALGQRKAGLFLQQQRLCRVDFPDDGRLFRNINTPADVRWLEQMGLE